MKNLLTICIAICSANAFAGLPIDSAQFYYNKGIEDKTARRFLLASQNFEKALAFNKNYTEAFIENGYAALEMRKTDLAVKSFTKANELQPGNMSVVKELTNLYYDYRQWDKAILFAKKCQDCSNADRIIGMSNYQKEEYPEAVKYLQKAIANSPADAQATYTLARTFLDMEDYKKAVPVFEKAVTLDPAKAEWQNELGLLYYNNNDFKGALAAFEKAKAAGFTVNNDFNENLGYAYLYSGNFAKGEELLMNVQQKKPGNKDITRDLAQVLYEQKQYDRSLFYCQKLMEQDANDGKALYQAGLNFQKKGQKDKGQAMCDKAIQMDPSLASKRTKQGDLGGGIGAL